MKSDRGRKSKPEVRETEEDVLAELVNIPADTFRAAHRSDQDSGTPLILTERDSQIAISHAIKQAMEQEGVTVYLLAEKSGLSVEVVQDYIDGSGSVSDTDPLTKLDRALRSLGACLEVPLSFL
jgi:hypothetical protein